MREERGEGLRGEKKGVVYKGECMTACVMRRDKSTRKVGLEGRQGRGKIMKYKKDTSVKEEGEYSLIK